MVGKSRKENKGGGGIGLLIKNNLFKAFSINQIDSNIEIVFLNVREKYNERLDTFVFYEKQESRTAKEEAVIKFAELETLIKKYSSKQYHISLAGVFNAAISNDVEKNERGEEEGGDTLVSRNGKLLKDLAKPYNIAILNTTDVYKGKWTRVNKKMKNNYL